MKIVDVRPDPGFLNPTRPQSHQTILTSLIPLTPIQVQYFLSIYQ